MTRTNIIFILLFCFQSLYSQTQEGYNRAFFQIKEQLESTDKESFKKSVFAVENAYMGEQLEYSEFEYYIGVLTYLIKEIKDNNALVDDYESKYYDIENIEKAAAIYRVMKDTLPILDETGEVYYRPPMTYDFDDMFGDEDWTKMFVSELLVTQTGNCHSLPYLYKILANEIGLEKAKLSLAPNHVYIKHFSQKYGWYNIELTSGYFPNDAWVMASGYVTMDAIKSGLFMRGLSEKESVALNLIDLAHGYDKQFLDNDGIFTAQCADLALQYFPDCVGALLLKAEHQKKQLEGRSELKGYENLLIAQDDPVLKNDYLAMQDAFVDLMKLGYRQMPKQMYVNWLLGIDEEREKYENKKVDGY